MKLKKIVKLLVLLLPITLFFGYKSEASSLPDISEDNFLTVNMIYKDGEKKIGISGAGIKITKLADIEIGSSLAIKNISLIGDLDIDWFNLTAEESNQLAKKISSLLLDSDVNSQVKTSDDLGKVEFPNLENAIYLVEEISKTGEAVKYSKIEPFFVILPQSYKKENGEFTWTRSVNAYPKTEIEKIKDERPNEPEDKNEKKKPDKTPKTGDDFALPVYVAVIALAGGILLILAKKSKKK